MYLCLFYLYEIKLAVNVINLTDKIFPVCFNLNLLVTKSKKSF